MLTHTTVKSHVCQECGEMFAYLSDVKNHMGTRTGVMPNASTECDKSSL